MLNLELNTKNGRFAIESIAHFTKKYEKAQSKLKILLDTINTRTQTTETSQVLPIAETATASLTPVDATQATTLSQASATAEKLTTANQTSNQLLSDSKSKRALKRARQNANAKKKSASTNADNAASNSFNTVAPSEPFQGITDTAYTNSEEAVANSALIPDSSGKLSSIDVSDQPKKYSNTIADVTATPATEKKSVPLAKEEVSSIAKKAPVVGLAATPKAKDAPKKSTPVTTPAQSTTAAKKTAPSTAQKIPATATTAASAIVPKSQNVVSSVPKKEKMTPSSSLAVAPQDQKKAHKSSTNNPSKKPAPVATHEQPTTAPNVTGSITITSTAKRTPTATPAVAATTLPKPQNWLTPSPKKAPSKKDPALVTANRPSTANKNKDPKKRETMSAVKRPTATNAAAIPAIVITPITDSTSIESKGGAAPASQVSSDFIQSSVASGRSDALSTIAQGTTEITSHASISPNSQSTYAALSRVLTHSTVNSAVNEIENDALAPATQLVSAALVSDTAAPNDEVLENSAAVPDPTLTDNEPDTLPSFPQQQPPIVLHPHLAHDTNWVGGTMGYPLQQNSFNPHWGQLPPQASSTHPTPAAFVVDHQYGQMGWGGAPFTTGTIPNHFYPPNAIPSTSEAMPPLSQMPPAMPSDVFTPNPVATAFIEGQRSVSVLALAFAAGQHSMFAAALGQSPTTVTPQAHYNAGTFATPPTPAVLPSYAAWPPAPYYAPVVSAPPSYGSPGTYHPPYTPPPAPMLSAPPPHTHGNYFAAPAPHLSAANYRYTAFPPSLPPDGSGSSQLSAGRGFKGGR